MTSEQRHVEEEGLAGCNGITDLLVRSLASPVYSRIVQALGSSRPAIVGVTGPPGVGKSTLCRLLHQLAVRDGECNARVAALEDYYYSRTEREARGLRWRAVPGSHRLEALRETLSSIRRGAIVRELPRYDMARDEVAGSEEVCGRISLLVLDGWLLKTELADYEFIGGMLDYLVYLHADEEDSRYWRFEREREGHLKGSGFSQSTMAAFWREALQPIARRWVTAQRQRADLVVEFDTTHRPVRFMERS